MHPMYCLLIPPALYCSGLNPNLANIGPLFTGGDAIVRFIRKRKENPDFDK